MKVIFIEDVPRVAKVGQTKDVAKGYARNYLFPKKMAILADSPAAKALEVHLKKLIKQHAIIEAEMSELAKKIQGVEITLKAKVGEKEKFYGSITTADIAEALSKAIDREIEKKRIEIAEPIRQVGVYDVIVRFTHDIFATIVVIAMSDAEGAAVPSRAVKEEVAEAKKEKKPKKEKAPKAEKEAKPEAEEKAEKPKTEKAEKAEKPAKEKKAKPAEAVKEEKPAKAEKPTKEEKPATEAKKEKKPKDKGKKTEKAAEK